MGTFRARSVKCIFAVFDGRCFHSKPSETGLQADRNETQHLARQSMPEIFSQTSNMVDLFIYLFFIYFFIYLFIHLICLFIHLFIHSFIYLFLSFFLSLFIYLFICLFS